MFKKLLMGIMTITSLFLQNAKGQMVDTTNHLSCGVSAAFFLSKGVNHADPSASATAALVTPSLFPSAAIRTCGPFTIYYEDLRINLLSHIAGGFADPSTGATRISTFCSVLTYMTTVFDFSKVPSGGIRLYIDTSYCAVFPFKRMTAPDKLSWNWGYGASFYGATNSGLVDGYVHDYIKTGIDPNPGDYHGYIQMNFDKALSWPGSFAGARASHDWVDWDAVLNNGLSPSTNCQADLYYRLLHTMGHVLGFAAFHDRRGMAHSLPYSPTIYTSLEMSLQNFSDLKTTPPLTLTPAYPFLFGGVSVVNNLSYPNNYFLSFDLCHFEDVEYNMALRVSPGDYHHPVMCVNWDWGINRRTFNKADLLTFKNAVGLDFNPTAFSSSSASAGLINNHVPYSNRMASMVYSTFFDLASVAERLPADYTITNNTGTNITIDLTALSADLHDEDGDPITIMDGSLVNLRGCGIGGNNHNLLTVNAAKNAITYTPRNNFYGRAQFGFNLWDGKEKGAYVIFTIQVNKGTRVSIPAGNNIVLNGDFEEGSEVRLLANSVDNFTSDWFIGQAGRFHRGQHFADSHPYDCYTNDFYGNAIRKSFEECQTVNSGFGNPYNSFPLSGGAVALANPATISITPGKPDVAPDAYFPAGVTQNDRYMILGGNGSLLYLGTTMQQCKVYQMEFDIRHRYSPAEFTYPAITSIAIGFTDDSHVVDPATLGTSSSTSLGLLTYNQMLPTHATSGVSSTSWKHETMYFTYCASNPSNVLYFNTGSSQVSGLYELIDNISIKEVTSIPLTVAVTATPLPSCNTMLSAGDIVNGCTSQTFSWNVKGSTTILATTRDYSFANPNVATTYQVTVGDGCHTAVGEYTVQPCPCTPGAVFKAAATTLSGTIATPLSAGYYYIPANINIAGSTTFTGANILIEPGVKITVNNSAILTLDGCHLFTCPDTNKLWQGIVLASGGTSGRIVVTNNTLIEDAVTAIAASYPTTPASGNIIQCSNSVFNRNRVGIAIDHYTMASPVTYPFSIKGTAFTCRNLATYTGYPNAWPASSPLRTVTGITAATPPLAIESYAMNTCKDGQIAASGISLTNVGYTNTAATAYSEIVIGDGSDPSVRNLFDNTGSGIVSSMSNLTCYNNWFIRMYPSTIYSLVSASGFGISATGTSPSGTDKYRLRALAVPAGLQGQTTENRFYDCKKGLSAGNFWRTNCIGNYFQTSTTTTSAPTSIPSQMGAWVSTAYFDSININSNNMYNTPVGINVSYLGSGSSYKHGQLNINNNNIYQQPVSPVTADPNRYVYQAINLSNVFTLPATGAATINLNTQYNVLNGIKLSGITTTPTTITNNPITLLDKTPVTSATVTQNAISVTSSKGLNISSNFLNTAALTATADRVNGVYTAFNANQNVCNNSTNNIGRAFNFAGTTTQFATIWNNNNITQSVKGFVLGSDIGDQNIGSTKLLSYIAPSGNIWNGTFTYQTYADGVTKSANSKLYVRNIPTGAVELPALNYALSYGNRYILGTSMFTSTAALFNCGVQKIILGGFTFKVLADSLGYDATYRPNQWMAEFALWQMGLMDSTLKDSSADYASFANIAANSRFAWLSNIEQALGNADVVTAQTLLNNPVAAMGRVVVNNNVVLTDYTEANYVVNNYVNYYTCYLHWLQGTMSSADTTSLTTLANRCPDIHGGVVYQARAFLDQLLDQIGSYNDDGCINTGGLYRIAQDNAGTDSPDYSLYPNPNEGSFTIMSLRGAKQTEPVTLKVYNAIGALVYQTNANFTNGSVQVNLGQKASGLYLVCIGDTNATCLRFIIK
jgi:hypothetical protein